MSIRLLLLAFLALAACGKKDNNLTDGDCTLKQEAEACADHVECCSGVCLNGACTSNANCDGFGVACSSGATCCSGQCKDDGTGTFTCGTGLGACEPLGAACTTAADCCSLGCQGGVCVDQICASIGGACGADSDCCGNDCAGTCQGGGACKPAGEDCTNGGDQSCCSRACVDLGGAMRCAAAPMCRVEGEVCSDNDDCCNFSCDGGKCRTLGDCVMVGESCNTDSECCGFTCRDLGNTGVKSCQYLGGYRPAGELCREDTDCCNNPVNNGPGVCMIFNQASGVGRCQNPGGCAPTGEVCGTSDGSPSGSNQCCPQPVPPGAPDPCQQTPIGTYRCFECYTMGQTCMDPTDCCSGTCTNGMCTCVGDGQSCQTGEECCSGICAPDGTGNLVCSPSCIPDGGTCTTNTDCCGGYCDPQTLTCLTIIL